MPPVPASVEGGTARSFSARFLLRYGSIGLAKLAVTVVLVTTPPAATSTRWTVHVTCAVIVAGCPIGRAKPLVSMLTWGGQLRPSRDKVAWALEVAAARAVVGSRAMDAWRAASRAAASTA